MTRPASAPLRCAALLLAAACAGEGNPTAPPTGPAISVHRVAHQDLACTDPCGMKLTYETRLAGSGEPVATSLQLSGDGWHPDRVYTALPQGRVTFFWEFPRPRVSGTSYRLTICPVVGNCAEVTATVYVPE